MERNRLKDSLTVSIQVRMKKEVKIFSSKVHSYVSSSLHLKVLLLASATQLGFLENKKGLSFRACHSKETELEQSYKRLFHNLQNKRQERVLYSAAYSTDFSGKKQVRWRFKFLLPIFDNRSRFSWDKVLLRSDFFEATPIHILSDTK